MLSSIVNAISTIIDKIFVDRNVAATAKLELDSLAKTGELAKILGHYNIGTAEASSKDKWTSRGRPAIIYVTLFLVLLSLPFSIFYILTPNIALEFIHGMQLWFDAIPKILYESMGAIIGLYTICRTVEKFKGVAR